MEPNHFQIILVLLVVAYKAWEVLRNAAKKKSEAARNVPVPQDLDQMPWEDPPEASPTPGEHSSPEVLRPAEVFSERHQETVNLVTTPSLRPAAIAPAPGSAPPPVATFGARAEMDPKLRNWMIGQVVLGKPVALAPRRVSFPVSR